MTLVLIDTEILLLRRAHEKVIYDRRLVLRQIFVLLVARVIQAHHLEQLLVIKNLHVEIQRIVDRPLLVADRLLDLVVVLLPSLQVPTEDLAEVREGKK